MTVKENVSMLCRTTALLILSVLMLSNCLMANAQVTCRIEGELKDTTQGRTIVVHPYNVDLRTSDNYVETRADSKGHFRLDVTADSINLYEVIIREQYETGRSWAYGQFLIEDGAKVNLQFANEKWQILSGGREQTKKIVMTRLADSLYLSPLQKIQDKIDSEIGPQVEKLKAEGKNPADDSTLVAKCNVFYAKYDSLFNAYMTWEIQYYADHPMLYALYDIAVMSHSRRLADKAEKLYLTHYSKLYPTSSAHKTMAELITANRLQPGKHYIDFQVSTPEGELVSVSSLRQDKVALIDFWASWCGPCRRHSKAMIPVYERFKDKGFTVIAIARERSLQDMISAMQRDGYPWSSYIDLNDKLGVWRKNGLSFAGGGMFLVDRDGTILSRSTDAEELEKFIEKALQ
jgi:thiol-disulfide isomerase/thioredoxin